MKHGIILNDDFFDFCAKKIITENGRYSLLQFLNSDEVYKEKYFFQICRGRKRIYATY